MRLNGSAYPIRILRGEANLAQASLLHHRAYLLLSKTALDARPESVQSIRPHGVETAISVKLQRPGRRNGQILSGSGQWPIYGGGNRFSENSADDEWRLAKDSPQNVRRLPQQPVPQRPIIKGVIEINQQGSPWGKFARQGAQCFCRVRDVVQDSN